MDSYEIKTLVGVENYDKGKALFDKGCVGPLTDLGHHLSFAEIMDNKDCFIVTVRSYPDGLKPMFECDCRSSKCRHVAALLLSMETDTKKIDDLDVIAEIEKDIDNLYNDIVSDSDYDEEANMYEDWEIRKYNLVNDNDSVEYDHTYDICERIVLNVSDPVTALKLFDRLHRSFDGFEYDNGGFEDAVKEFDDNLKVLFTYADPKLVAQILSSGSNYSGSWGEKYMKYVPKNIVEQSDKYVGEQKTLNRTGLEIVLKNREYGTYIEKSNDKVRAYMTVIDEMRRNNDERTPDYAKILYGMGDREYCSVQIADTISVVGLKREAANLYSISFVKSPKTEILDKLKSISEKEFVEDTLDKAVAEHLCGKFYRMSTSICLAECGRCDKVEKFIREVDFAVEEFSYRYGPEYRGAQTLCIILLNNGYVETSARIAHDVIEYRLNRKDNKQYDDGVMLLKFLDSRKEFENIEPKHSEYLANLKQEYGTMRKFWGMYNGTWVDKKRSGHYW